LGLIGKVLFLPFKFLVWAVTLPLRIVTGPLRLMVAILILALIIAGIQIVLFQQFFGD